MADDEGKSGGIIGAIVGIAAAITGAFSSPSNTSAGEDYLKYRQNEAKERNVRESDRPNDD